MPLRSLGLRATILAAALTTATVLTALPAAAGTPPAGPAGPATGTPSGPSLPGKPAQPVPQPPQTAQTPQGPQVKPEPLAGGYKGRVIARGGLYLRDKPTRGSRVIGLARYGKIVHIFCKTRGDNVAGNNRWYLLTDGTWAWGSAKYIANVGPGPRSC
jgi:uncharacterized protein YgiM (DUF1202 family)